MATSRYRCHPFYRGLSILSAVKQDRQGFLGLNGGSSRAAPQKIPSKYSRHFERDRAGDRPTIVRVMMSSGDQHPNSFGSP
jgi:hypothetical protein